MLGIGPWLLQEMFVCAEEAPVLVLRAPAAGCQRHGQTDDAQI